MEQPFIRSVPAEHFIHVWSAAGIDNVGTQGYNAVWGTTMPFVPYLPSGNALGCSGTPLSRMHQVILRQIQFLNSLANLHDFPDDAVAFDLRIVVHPADDTRSGTTIEVALLGKVWNENRKAAEMLATELWHRFYAKFPRQEPLNYPLTPVVGKEEIDRLMTPIALDTLGPGDVIEFAKYVDHDPYLEDATSWTGCFVHSFDPMLGLRDTFNLFEELSLQSEPCAVSIRIRPTRLMPEEMELLREAESRYRALNEEAEPWKRTHNLKRLTSIERINHKLFEHSRSLYMLAAQIVGPADTIGRLVHPLGVLLVQGSTLTHRKWDMQRPQEAGELAIALANFRQLEHRAWQSSVAEPHTARLPYLLTPEEAAAAFQLPVAPPDGILPGIKVSDDTFVKPAHLSPSSVPAITLGEILHHGQPSGSDFQLPLNRLLGHMLIAGASGSGKTTTVLNCLTRAWEVGIPFLVLHPMDRPVFRHLMAHPATRDQLLVYTIGDEHVSPLRFSPFAVPPGISVCTHLDAVVRTFRNAFRLRDPLPSFYRQAVQALYQRCGWDLARGQSDDRRGATPTMTQFYSVLVETVSDSTRDLGDDAAESIRSGSEYRIRALLANLGPVLDTTQRAPIDRIMTSPTVMELSRIGSDEDIALVMGFILTMVAEAAQLRTFPQPPTRPAHITVVERARLLMSPWPGGENDDGLRPRAGGEDASQILQDVHGFGESFILAEHRPATLSPNAVAGTGTQIMHWLEDDPSFRLVREMLRLDSVERTLARTLPEGHAITQGPEGRPIHVQVPPYTAHAADVSDAAVAAFMRGRRTVV